ncbi:hypothetical protein FHS89_001012 [Rubricella aquisinus]|uniref:Uncharacterized protein n=1 Tax=Rubricella aquisinus TaxID=2028108 RepID=A0A840WMW8_9RHOB|nr:hypothetical protein [Rubricella aquisinus]MBB5515002.1 hypothetical protein [Rubricella aquisinus]
MSDGTFSLLGVFGILCILSILRVGMAVIADRHLLRASGWMWVTFSVGLYAELTSPIGADFQAVMRGLIHFAAMIL